MAHIYSFDHAHAKAPRELSDLLGGKGANLAEMSSVMHLPVPPGFTITTDACRYYFEHHLWPEGLERELAVSVGELETAMGKRFGDSADPLLLSVRSGAKFSMPGMMDTVLDLGLNDESVKGLMSLTGNAEFAWDSYRRFIQMFGGVVLGVSGERFDEVLAKNLGPKETVAEFKEVVAAHTGEAFPQEPMDQLRRSINAVFLSWDAPRAHAYREREGIDHYLGTAVNVQAMVFGNRDTNSGTGVGFTRDPATGATGAYGDFLVQAQGEDVVAGTHKTQPLSDLATVFPEVYNELMDIFHRMEHHYRDMLDTEFTIEQGRLWMLQTRIGKRTGRAAVRMAVEMVDDPNIALSRQEAVKRVKPEQLDQLLHDQFENMAPELVVATGLGASPGAAVGQVYFSAEAAVEAHQAGEKVVLVRSETSPEDIHGMQVAEGVLTIRGGLVSHAAVVARGWGKPAVVGVEALVMGDGFFSVGGTQVFEGDTISIDGTVGAMALGALPLVRATAPAELNVLLSWADELRGNRLSVRANADNGPDARVARDFGATGIGLCRTEHMFFGDRLPVVRRLILAESDAVREAALAELVSVQTDDFGRILEAMDGLPVTVRLLDPPLHEFLPDHDELLRDAVLGRLDAQGQAMFDVSERLREDNPMLGTRGVRLGILIRGLYQAQTKALMQAAKKRVAAGGKPIVEIMVPLVITAAEQKLVRSWIEQEVEESGFTSEHGSIAIGSMIETPRAALVAGDIAHYADFFSFGTNDLTQMAMGLSRDDVESHLLPEYLKRGIFSENPFETIDEAGVGELVELGVERGRATNPNIEIGVCGEHGGDPRSIHFFARAGLDYVSCSPYRVPVARLAAAQAVLEHA